MTLDTLAKLGEVIGGAVIVASIFYLALQARQSDQSQRSENDGRTVDRIGAILAQLAENAELTRIVAIGSSDLTNLEPIDRVRFGWVMHQIFGAYEFIFQQHRSNLIHSDVWERYFSDFSVWISCPGVRTWWDEGIGSFTPAFTTLVTNHLSKPGLSPDAVNDIWGIQ